MKKMIISFSLLLLWNQSSFSQTPIEKVEDSEISKVTLFLQGAQIQRKATVSLATGKTLLKFKNLSPVLDPKSIQVKLTNSATLLTVNHYLDYLSDQTMPDELAEFDNQITSTQDSINIQKVLLKSLEEELAFLKANRSVKGSSQNLQYASLKETYDFFADQTKELYLEQFSIKERIKKLEASKKKLELQKRELFKNPDNRKSEIQILLSVDQATKVDLEFSYLCGGAGWFPNYDIVAKDVESPIELLYKARVYQRTGEDWDQIKLSLSNADPYKSGSLPFLEPLYLNYNTYAYKRESTATGPNSPLAFNNGKIEGVIRGEDGEPLIGASILIKGASVGTVTDLDGRYSLSVPEGTSSIIVSYTGFESREIALDGTGNLDVNLEAGQILNEVVVTGMGSSSLSGRANGVSARGTASIKKERSIPVNPIQNQTTISFEVDLPFSVPSNGESFQVELAQYEVPAYFEYQSAPKVEREPFLVAKIVNWDEYNLLEGEANIFFEDLYLGRSVLDVRFVADTLNISLGRDKGIMVNREKIKDFYKENFVGNRKVESRSFRISIQNNKNQNINMVLKDQIPISQVKDIEIQKVDLGGGQLNENTGEVKWFLQIGPGESREINLKYSVKFDRHKNLRVE